MSDPAKIGVSRRTLAKGAAWTVPAAAVVAAAPAYAASLRKDPGINGWVQNRPVSLSNGWWDPCRWQLDVDSTLSGTGTDGAPFGLYIYDVEDPNTFSQAKLTYWIIGNQSASWTPRSGHSPCWSGPVRGTPTSAGRPDGLLYTPYTWTYTCPISPDMRVVDSDGVERLHLGDFHVRATFTQPSDRCNNVTYWTQRHITIDKDGPGSLFDPEVHTFQRRNGAFGGCTGTPGTLSCRTN